MFVLIKEGSSLLLVQFHLCVIISFIYFMEHIFQKIILNIYFDHIHIMCLYRVFSVFCTGYMLVFNESCDFLNTHVDDLFACHVVV